MWGGAASLPSLQMTVLPGQPLEMVQSCSRDALPRPPGQFCLQESCSGYESLCGLVGENPIALGNLVDKEKALPEAREAGRGGLGWKMLLEHVDP